MSNHQTDRTPGISSSSDVLGGTPVFRDTRVPLQTLWDYIEAGESLDVFLSDFPSVPREQAVEVLEQARMDLVASLGP